jgi:hypothetical protein
VCVRARARARVCVCVWNSWNTITILYHTLFYVCIWLNSWTEFVCIYVHIQWILTWFILISIYDSHLTNLFFFCSVDSTYHYTNYPMYFVNFSRSFVRKYSHFPLKWVRVHQRPVGRSAGRRGTVLSEVKFGLLHSAAFTGKILNHRSSRDEAF